MQGPARRIPIQLEVVILARLSYCTPEASFNMHAHRPEQPRTMGSSADPRGQLLAILPHLLRRLSSEVWCVQPVTT